MLFYIISILALIYSGIKLNSDDRWLVVMIIIYLIDVSNSALFLWCNLC